MVNMDTTPQVICYGSEWHGKKISKAPMKLLSSIALHPICLFIALGLVVLLIPSLVIATWYVMASRVEDTIQNVFYSAQNGLLSQIKTTTKSIFPINSSALNLVRVLWSSVNQTKLSFSALETKVAPNLFLVFSIVPNLSQVSYIGLDGLLFSYLNDGDQIFALYSNTSCSSIMTATNATAISWYTQPVNHDTGKRYGEANSVNPFAAVNASWFQEPLKSTTGYYSLGPRWNKAQNRLFLDTATMDGLGVISLGFSVMDLMGFFSDIDLYGGDLYLATENGELLTHIGPLNTHIVFINNNITVSVQSVKPSGDLAGQAVNISCTPDNYLSRSSIVKIRGIKYTIYCGRLEIAGVQSVYVYAFRQRGLTSLFHKDSKLAFLLLLLMLVSMVLSIFFFILLIVRAVRGEILLCAILIKQMEATQQAERKNMNKSLAFASASHDVRASLAAITGLIRFCCQGVAPESELKKNLVQMNACVEDLLGILNSVLDTSKIEAGKMHLEEEEFDLALLLEDVVNMYYHVGMKKGVDMLLDPCDGSIHKFCFVKGDRGKLKQILCNLLSNAVKFTSEGHVSLRAWIKKPSLENSILASNHSGIWSCLSRLIYKNSEACNDLSTLRSVQQNPDAMEFLFEVDDTGKGIPKEKQKSVFENFVQVKETALGQGGHGLGLGIVQSLVRLMGGEITIMDKEIGERGTCFKFNVFLSTCGAASSTIIGEENKLQGDNISNDLQQHLGLNIWNQNLKSECSHVVLLIQGDERRRISQKLMESLGIKVSIVNRWEHLFPTLEKIRHKLYLNHLSSSGKSEFGSLSDYLSTSASYNSNVAAMDRLVSNRDGNDFIHSIYKKTNFRVINYVLIIIDIDAGPFLEMSEIISNFTRELYGSRCKVVWLESLDKPVTRSSNLKSSEGGILAPCDYIVSKPFHGSRLYQVLGILPEFGGTIQGNLPKSKRETTAQVTQISSDPNPSTEQTHIKSNSGILQSYHKHSLQRRVVHEGNERPLSGKKILVAEDYEIFRKIADATLSRLGATVEFCKNGEEALKQVCKALSEADQIVKGASQTLPYDVILMDCQMPIMDGYEATRLIRMEEKRYGVRIPIIALTAHAEAAETIKIIQSGMDFHLTKPLQEDQLLGHLFNLYTK